MDYFSQNDLKIINDRVKIVKNKIRNIPYQKMLKKINIESYVRVQFILGEPCWGRRSPLRFPRYLPFVR